MSQQINNSFCLVNFREYAESIEVRLKKLGLTVDLLFPNEEVPVSRVLAKIASRGSLYAILIMPQNEDHRSLTLNILHGQPQGWCFYFVYFLHHFYIKAR